MVEFDGNDSAFVRAAENREAECGGEHLGEERDDVDV
jgi:hypothetical protein